MEARQIFYTCLMTVPCLIISQQAFGASRGAFIGVGISFGEIDTSNKVSFNAGAPTDPGGTGSGVVVNKSQHDVGGFGASLFAGYNFTKNIGLEASYNHYADSDYSTKQTNTDTATPENNAVVNAKIEFQTRTYNIAAKGYLPFDNGFELFARAGAEYVIQKVKYENATNNPGAAIVFVVPVDNDAIATPKLGTTTTKRIRPMAGFGAGYNFTKSVGVSFSWNHVFGSGNLKTDRDAIADLDMVTLELTYTFA